jgi:hypothetical protein
MYPVRNNAEHDKDGSEDPRDQSQVSPSENDALANQIVIEHRRPSDHLFVRLPVCPHSDGDDGKACDDREHESALPFTSGTNLRTLL